MIQVDYQAICAGLAGQSLLQAGVIYPGEQVAAVAHRPFQEVDLGAQTMVWDDDYPAAAEAVLDLVFVDHAGSSEHEGPSMDVDNWSLGG